MKEFNLSKKLWSVGDTEANDALWIEDIREFIKLLKEELGNPEFFSPAQYKIITEFIDKLAGEDLK